MSRIHRLCTIPLLIWGLSGCGGGGTGGFLTGGGQSGTGISTIRGNVIDVSNTTADVSGIRVSVVGTKLEDLTDSIGVFDLDGELDGEATLRFERGPLLAETQVIVPGGGLLELRDVILDTDNGTAQPTTQRVELEGFVDTVDCGAGVLLVISKERRNGTVFSVELSSATIRRDATVLDCTDLRVDDRVEVKGDTVDGVTLLRATIKVEDREDEEPTPTDEEDDEEGKEEEEEEPQPPAGEIEIEGVVHALDCAGGSVSVRHKEDGTVFEIEVASATFLLESTVLDCADLLIDDRVQVLAETEDGATLIRAEVQVEDREDDDPDTPDDENDPDDEVDDEEDPESNPDRELEFEGLIRSLDCNQGDVVVVNKATQATFTVDAGSAVILADRIILACTELLVGDRFEIRAELVDNRLVNATMKLEDREDDG